MGNTLSSSRRRVFVKSTKGTRVFSVEVERNSARFGQLRFRVEDRLKRERNYNYAPSEYVEFFLQGDAGSERFHDEDVVPAELGKDKAHPILFLSGVSPAEEVLKLLRGPQGTAIREAISK